MATHIFGSVVDIESGITRLDRIDPVHQKAENPTVPVPSPLELDELELGISHARPLTPGALPGESAQSQPATPATPAHEAIDSGHSSSEALQTWSHAANKWRVLSCCVIYFNNGMSDSAPGALLPYMETHYNIGYAVVSLIFVAQAIGFLSAAFFNDMMKSRLGVARTLALSEVILAVAYALIVATPPYPVVVLAFFLIGWAASTTLALSNVFCANLANSTVILGAVQGAYGIGGTIGPIIATSIVSKGKLWSKYYFITLSTSLFSAVASGWFFRHHEGEHSTRLLSALQREASRQTGGVSRQSKRGLLVQALKYKVTLIGALFTFAYQGAEVSYYITFTALLFILTPSGFD
jgi:fucose permease